MGDSTFPRWFLFGSLHSMNWPRKEGFARRPVVETMVIDVVATSMGRYGRVLGATDRGLGLRLIADAFRARNWELQPASELGEMLDKTRTAGWLQMTKLGDKVPWELLSRAEFEVDLVAWFVAEVWYGLMHADEVMQAFDSEMAGSRAHAREWASHGLGVNPANIPESAMELAAMATEFVKAFEEETGALPEAHPRLTAFVDERASR